MNICVLDEDELILSDKKPWSVQIKRVKETKHAEQSI